MKDRRRTKVDRLSGRRVSVRGEAEYIVRRAARGKAHVVTLGLLLFFSTETGDAWVLDPDDQLALCLASDGAPQPARITETPDNFAIEWAATYRIDGDVMTLIEPSGRERAVMGYPVGEIQQAIQRMRAAL